MDEGVDEVPTDVDLLRSLLLRGASTVREVEAAERLVIQVEPLRNWLIRNGFLRMHRSSSGHPYAATHFPEAYEATIQLMQAGGDRALADSGLSKSEWSVLGIVANLSGTVRSSIRYSVHNIEPDHAKRVAEAVLYAIGYMDAVVDVTGNEVDGVGPNGEDYDRRLGEVW